tara:strand:- start:3099 stop:3395 length:297 start_codon:yes stop_codon:yes gene_type:complete
MNPDIIRDKDKYNDWDNPYYMAGYASGCESASKTATYDWKQQEQTDDALRQIMFKDQAIKALNDKVEELEDIIDALNQPWYIKLWNKTPKISIQITRR